MRRTPVYRHEGFRQLVDHFYTGFLTRNPILATWLGEHDFDGLLPEVGAEAAEKETAFFRSMRDAFLTLPERELSLDEKLDRQVALHLAASRLFLLDDLGRWRHGTDLAMTLGHSLYLLFVRDFAPLAFRVESMISRLRAAPMFFQSGRTTFQDVPALWGEIYLESAERLPLLLDTISRSIQGRVPAPLQGSFNQAADQARDALRQFGHWFRNAIMPEAKGQWALGGPSFQALLALRSLGLNEREIREIGDATLHQSMEKIDRLGRNITGLAATTTGNIREEARKRVRSRRPESFAMALETYRDVLSRSRAFVEMAGFATLPANESLEILETPEYMAHLIPFAAYLGPERKAEHPKGLYLVTRPVSDSAMGAHYYADIVNCAMHEGYPGHHLQLTAAGRHPGKIRALADSIEMVEGWAHYGKQEMRECGFETTDENSFVHAEDEIWRACRILVDLNIQQKTWNFSQARQFLLDLTNMPVEAATAEIRWCTQNPGAPLSSLVGKHLLSDLKASLKKRFKADFKPREFHDLALYEGCIPIFLAQRFFPQFMHQGLAVEAR